jgi:hypothetical protein
MDEGALTGQKSSVMIKAQYSWTDPEPRQGVGLVTAIGPRHAFVYTKVSPPLGTLVRLKLPQVGKSGAVELRGVTTESEGQTTEGFGIQFSEFIRGEAVLLDFLGLPRSAAGALTLPEPPPPAPEPEAAPEVLEGEVSVRVGLTRPTQPGTLVDISETGLYLRTGAGGDEPWQLKQNARLEFSVPMGHGVRSEPAIGRIVRIDPPPDPPGSDPSWGLGLQFRAGHAPPQEIVRRIQIYIHRGASETVDRRELWQSDDAPEAPALKSKEVEAGRSTWTRGMIIAAIVIFVIWLVAVWWLTMWRFEMLMGPPPDPNTLPKPP